MRYIIYKDGEQINTIVADVDFCKAYCEVNGYTYEEEVIINPEPTPEPEIIDPQADTDAMLVDLEYRLTLLELGLEG